MASIQRIAQTAAKAAAPTAPGQSLAWTAQHLAALQTKQAEDAIRAQQAQAQQQAAAQAALIKRASTAAAGFLKPLGDLTQADYAQALQQNTGLAQGYSGQLRTDAADQAARAQASLASIHGNTQQVTDRGDSLANLLYGLQGSLPGQALVTEGLGQTAAARALPASLLASGLNEQYGVLGAGRKEAATFNPQLAAIQAKQPELAHQILGDLISQQQKQAAAEATAAYRNRPEVRSVGGGLVAIDPRTGKTTVLVQPPPQAPEIRSIGNGGLVQVNPNGTVTTLREPTASPVTPHYAKVTDSKGTYIVNEATGERRRVSGPPASSSRTGKNAPKYAFGNEGGYIYDSGTKKTVRVGPPETGTGASPGVSRSDAISLWKNAVELAQTGRGKLILNKRVGQQPYEQVLQAVTSFFVGAGYDPNLAAAQAVKAMTAGGWKAGWFGAGVPIPQIQP